MSVYPLNELASRYSSKSTISFNKNSCRQSPYTCLLGRKNTHSLTATLFLFIRQKKITPIIKTNTEIKKEREKDASCLRRDFMKKRISRGEKVSLAWLGVDKEPKNRLKSSTESCAYHWRRISSPSTVKQRRFQWKINWFHPELRGYNHYRNGD